VYKGDAGREGLDQYLDNSLEIPQKKGEKPLLHDERLDKSYATIEIEEDTSSNKRLSS
jgi:hypothetical protein